MGYYQLVSFLVKCLRDVKFNSVSIASGLFLGKLCNLNEDQLIWSMLFGLELDGKSHRFPIAQFLWMTYVRSVRRQPNAIGFALLQFLLRLPYRLHSCLLVFCPSTWFWSFYCVIIVRKYRMFICIWALVCCTQAFSRRIKSNKNITVWTMWKRQISQRGWS